MRYFDTRCMFSTYRSYLQVQIGTYAHVYGILEYTTKLSIQKECIVKQKYEVAMIFFIICRNWNCCSFYRESNSNFDIDRNCESYVNVDDVIRICGILVSMAHVRSLGLRSAVSRCTRSISSLQGTQITR